MRKKTDNGKFLLLGLEPGSYSVPTTGDHCTYGIDLYDITVDSGYGVNRATRSLTVETEVVSV